MRIRRIRTILVPLLAAGMLAAGCSSQQATSAGPGTATGTQSTPAATAAGGATASGTATPGSAPSGTSEAAAPTGAAPGIGADGCITHFDPAADYFPVKSTLQYATNFTISYHKSYQVLTVKQPTQGGSPVSYVLVRCGAPKPRLTGALADATEVTTPVHSLYTASTSHLPSLVALGQVDIITGVASKAQISEKQVLAHVASSGVAQFAAKGTVDAETVVAGKPDVLITGGFDDPAFPIIAKAGIPVLADSDWLEPTPLGRAEWIKYFAALTGTEAKAAQYFDMVVKNYHEIAAKAAGAAKVQILPGQPYQGTWYVPGGKSFNARLFADAGGTTAWADTTSTGSISTNLETVLAKASNAQVWLASTTWTRKADVVAQDPRLADFAAFKSGNIWNPVKQVSATGANNYYELGVARPDLILGDLVAILHPGALPHHDFTFYLKLQ